MTWLRQQRGRRAEQVAASFLSRRGYLIERRNVRYPVGEIDLIARQGRALCFIEVRSVSSRAWGGPLATVTDRKRQRLIRAARWYLARLRELPPEIRFDVIGITWRDDGPPAIELILSAFDASSAHHGRTAAW